MELKQYIKEVISQISEATTEINSGDTAVVNPLITELREVNGRTLFVHSVTPDAMIPATQIVEVDFDVAITASDKSEAGGKLGISVIGIGGSTGQENHMKNRVKFTLPVVFPAKKVKR